MQDLYFEELFALSSDLMVVLDLAGSVVQVNNAFLHLLGCTAQEVKGHPLVRFTAPEERMQFAGALARVSHGYSMVRIDVNFRTRENGVKHCDFTLRPSISGEYIMAVGRNLNAWHQCCNAMCKEHQAMERLIAERTGDLQRVNTELEAFNFSISHDLRAPLRAISGFSRAITEDYGERLDQRGLDYLDRIRANCERMSILIGYLLQLSRLSRQELHRSRVDLGAVADSIIADLQASDPSRIVHFSRKGTMEIEGDKELLYQLLQNLLGNAWKYTARREEGRIVFSAEESCGERVFTVFDNGVGFPVAQCDKLFILFQRLHNPDEYEGMGIGLATAQRIVHRHGGRIWGESIEGEQASFRFTLQRMT